MLPNHACKIQTSLFHKIALRRMAKQGCNIPLHKHKVMTCCEYLQPNLLEAPSLRARLGVQLRLAQRIRSSLQQRNKPAFKVCICHAFPKELTNCQQSIGCDTVSLHVAWKY